MTIKVKIKPDALPSSAMTTGATAQWRQNRQMPRAVVPAKLSRGAIPATPNFDGTYNGLKGRDLVFNPNNLCADRFTHVRHEIAKYVGKEYTDEGDVRWTLKHEKMKTITPPSRIGVGATDLEKYIFKVEVSECVKRRNRLQDNLEKRYTLILGQCTELNHMNLEGLPEWEATYDTSDGIKLLKIIQSIAHQETDQQYYPLYLYS